MFMKKRMVITTDVEIGYRFEKDPTGSTINVFRIVDSGFETYIDVDVFTHYDINSDWGKFEAACEEYLQNEGIV